MVNVDSETYLPIVDTSLLKETEQKVEKSNHEKVGDNAECITNEVYYEQGNPAIFKHLPFPSNKTNKTEICNAELEYLVLCEINIAAQENILSDDVFDMLQDVDFADITNNYIFSNMKKMYKNFSKIDLSLFYASLMDDISLKTTLKDMVLNQIIEITSYVVIADRVTKQLLEQHILELKKYTQKRSINTFASEVTNITKDITLTPDEIIDNIKNKIKLLEEKSITINKKNLESISDIASRHADRLNELVLHYKETGSTITGVESGFQALDNITNGFQKSDLIIIAGRPGMGKTAFGLSVILNAAAAGKSIAFFSLEMSSEQLYQRLVSAKAKINQKALRSGKLTQKEVAEYLDATTELCEYNIFIDDTASITASMVKDKCLKLIEQQGELDLIVIDYLQIMGTRQVYGQNREQQISELSRELKRIAKELNVPVIALAQVNRNVEKAENKRPVMSDLRESGAIEQDADIIMFLYRDKVYNEDSPLGDIAEVIIKKHRNGENGVAYIQYDSAYTLFNKDVVINQFDASQRAKETFVRRRKGNSQTTNILSLGKSIERINNETGEVLS